MDLLTKFETVEIKSGTRITEMDKVFCESHQAAYQAARSSLLELQYFWEDILQTQSNLLSETDAHQTLYLTNTDILRISTEKIQDQLKEMHSIFIGQIVDHFNHLYHVTISSSDIRNTLLPQKPERRTYDEDSLEQYRKEREDYESELLNLSLSYENILEQLFHQMDGRGLWEQALHELKEKCHSAAWCSYSNKTKYELKKETLRFSDYACRYDHGYSYNRWSLTDGLKNILHGIAHFETGSFSYIPHDINSLLGYSISSDFTTFPTCQKVTQIKLFKNGRVDIKFSNAAYAREFVEDYLVNVC